MLSFLGFQINMHHDDIVYESLRSKNFFKQHRAVQTQDNIQIFLDRKVELLALCLSTCQ